MTQSIRSRTIARKTRYEGARMLVLNRNHQSLVATTNFNLRSVGVRGMALIVICGMISAPSTTSAQGSDSNYRNSHADRPPSREPSILIRDEHPAPPAAFQPLRPRVSDQSLTRPSDQPQPLRPSLQPQVSSSGFQVPSSPTREDFTNPSTDSAERAKVSDGSAAVGTFAHQSREPADQFAAPSPPAAPIRSFGSASIPVRVGQPDRAIQPPQPDHETSPMVHNDLRSKSIDSMSDSSSGTPRDFGRIAKPKADPMTASPRFVDTRPAPPASMPGTSPQRFNPQIFSQPQASNSQAAQAQPVRPFTSKPVQASNNSAIDNQVAPTSFAQAIPNETSGTTDLAQKIVDRYSMDNAPEPLPGEPITLTEMFQQPLPQQYRPGMVSQYWETWFDWASMQNAIAYQEWLDSIPNASAQGEQGLLDTARSAAENQVLAAKIQLGKSQAKLVRFMPTRRSSLAPLPSDSPLVERYETHYELYKARNLLPAKLIGIDQMLPQTLTLIDQRAETVQKSQAAIKQNLDGYSTKRVPLASVLEAARVWRSAEQDLLASVTSYNQAIADYAFNITRRQTTPEQTVAMLIGTRKSNTEQRPATSRAASSIINRGNDRNRNASSGNRTAAAFDQPTSNRTRAASSNVAQSSNIDTLASNEKLAPTNRPAWGGGNSSGTRPSNASRSTADARPSLGTTSQRSFGGPSSRSRTTSPAATSPAAYGGSPSRMPNSATSPTSTRPPNRNFGGRPSFGDRTNSATSNGLSATGSAASSSRASAAATTPAAPTQPQRKPFPLPKRPTTSGNSFGGF